MRQVHETFQGVPKFNDTLKGFEQEYGSKITDPNAFITSFQVKNFYKLYLESIQEQNKTLLLQTNNLRNDILKTSTKELKNQNKEKVVNPETKAKISDLITLGLSFREIGRQLKLSGNTIKRIYENS